MCRAKGELSYWTITNDRGYLFSGMDCCENIQEKVYQPNKGIAMGSPISGTMAEVCLQHLEHIHIRPLLEDKCILLYTRYVDDILIIYDTESTSHDYLTQ